MSATPIIFNGKFLSARPTGVHRVAWELIVQLDDLLGAEEASGQRSWSMVCPSDARAPLPLSRIRRKSGGSLTWQAWEQFELPGLAKGAVLVNLCNLAPLAHPCSVTLIHDAQVFLSPASYSWVFRNWYRFALPRIGASAARIVTVSNYSRDKLIEAGVAAPNKIDVVYNGADHMMRTAADPSIVVRLGLTAERYVLAVSSAQAHKNVSLLFKVFSDGPLDGLPLVLAGADGTAAFEAVGRPAPPGVIFAGRVTDGELRALYESATCLAFPSLTEGFGLPPLEAMSVGCPTIVAPCGALPEVCGGATLYASPDNAADWAAAILAIARDNELRSRLAAEGVFRAGLFLWRESAIRLKTLIEDVA